MEGWEAVVSAPDETTLALVEAVREALVSEETIGLRGRYVPSFTGPSGLRDTLDAWDAAHPKPCNRRVVLRRPAQDTTGIHPCHLTGPHSLHETDMGAGILTWEV